MIKIERRFNLTVISIALAGCATLAYVDAFALKLFPPRLRQDYLASLRENSEIGCSTVGFNEPDALFLGDSHSYAAWNFVELEKQLSPLKISACAMGGLYVETATDILESLDSEKQGWPRFVVYGVSARQFIVGKNKPEQLQEHRKVLAQIGWGKVFSGKADLGRAFEILKAVLHGRELSEWQSAARQAEILKVNEPLIGKVDESDAGGLFDGIENRSKSSWREFLAQARITDESIQQAKAFCDVVRKKKIQLTIVDLPESPFLESQYRPELRAKYAEVWGELSKCSTHALQIAPNQHLLGNRHFMNRPMDPDFPYSKLSRLEDLKSKTEAYRNGLFDLDHLNLVGATLFTRTLGPKLKMFLAN